MSYTPFRYVCLALLWIVAWPLAQAQSPAQRVARVPFHLEDRFVVVVPVMVEGKGPFDFAVDTGATETVVDQRLATELVLKPLGRVRMTTLQGEAEIPLVHLHTLSVGGVEGHGLAVMALPGAHPWTWKVRGILGEDFLKHFELLLDYRRHIVEIGTEPEAVSERFEGDHVAFRTEGRFRGEPTKNRLVVAAGAEELGGGELDLLIDSGANALMVFHRAGIGVRGPSDAIQMTTASSTGTVRAETKRLRLLRVGTARIREPEVVLAPDAQAIDADGLLPTRLFDSILISHAGRYVIFNPTPRQERAGLSLP